MQHIARAPVDDRALLVESLTREITDVQVEILERRGRLARLRQMQLEAETGFQPGDLVACGPNRAFVCAFADIDEPAWLIRRVSTSGFAAPTTEIMRDPRAWVLASSLIELN